jgi:hypothetical protein
VTRRFRLTRLFYRATWKPWQLVAHTIEKKHKRREIFLSIFGPLSLLALLVVWAVTVVFGFAMVHWGIGSRVGAIGTRAGFFTDLYYSGTTFFTLGLGDIAPVSVGARAMTVLEASIGFGMLALVIGYLPVLYQAFSPRGKHLHARCSCGHTAHRQRALAAASGRRRAWRVWMNGCVIGKCGRRI